MILLKNGNVYDAENDVLLKKDLLIDGGVIVEISDNINEVDYKDVEQFDVQGMLVFPALIDTHTHLRQPGYEHKETIESGTKSAVKGGYGTVFAMANIIPTVDSVKNYHYINKLIKDNSLCTVYPMGALSKDIMGIELSDIEEISPYVKCFSDDGKYLEDVNLKDQAMNILAKTNKVYVSHSEVAEYIVSDNRKSEYDGVRQDLETVRNTGVKYHVCHVSTKETIDYIRQAKKEGLNVSCEVAPHHLTLTADDINDNPNFKMNPPLRPRSDRDYLIEALLDGTIDNIATDHAPHTEEEKAIEYNKAPNGIIGLETAFPLIYTNFIDNKKGTLKQLYNWFVKNPSKIFDMKPYKIKVGEPCNLAVFDINNTHVYCKEEILSKSKNSPYIGVRLKGMTHLTILNGKILYKRGE